MVASTLEAPAVAKPRKKKPGERGPEIPVLIRMRVRTMYLNSGLPLKEISTRTGLPVGTIAAMARRDGWTIEKESRKAKLIAKQDAQGDELRDQVMTLIADESLEICGSALKVTRAGLEEGDLEGAKKAQAASSTLKNLVTSAKVLREPGNVAESTVTNFNLFFAGASQGAAPIVQEPKQVTEIETEPKK